MISKLLGFSSFFLLAATVPLLADSTTNPAPATPPVPPSVPANPAVVPLKNTAKDNYNFDERHAAVLAQKDALKPQIVLIGDSITMRWGGPPAKGTLRPSWKDAFGDVPTLNLGFGYDLTQNVLWRLDNGEFDGLTPKTVVILIGTNNITGAPGTPRSLATKPEQTVEGIMAIIDRVKAKSPTSKIIVTKVLPRGNLPTDGRRAAVDKINAVLTTTLAAHPEIEVIDIGASFIQPDGTVPKTLLPDGTHPSEAGYEIWAKALAAALAHG